MAPQEALQKVQQYIGGIRGAVAILVAAVTLVVWAVRQEARITDATNKVQNAQEKIAALDVHGTRAAAERFGVLSERVSVMERRVNSAAQFLGEQDAALTRRIEAIEPSARSVDVLNSKQQDILRRVEHLEKETSALDVLAAEVQRLREQTKPK